MPHQQQVSRPGRYLVPPLHERSRLGLNWCIRHDANGTVTSLDYSPRDCGSLNDALRVPVDDGGGTTGPMSPSGATSRSTITGA